MTRRTYVTVATRCNLNLVLDFCAIKPASAEEIAEHLSVSVTSAHSYAKHLITEGKMHIDEWHKTANNRPLKIYGIGRHEDAMKPVKRTASENKAVWLAKRKEKAEQVKLPALCNFTQQSWLSPVTG